MRWSVVVPVKRLRLAKSRLYAVGLPRPEHEELALSLALDTFAAALRAPAVDRLLVVTDDPVVREAVAAAAAIVLPDEPDAGLNPALSHGAGAATRLAPAAGVALLSADLPALRPAELAAALAAAAGPDAAFVADARGTGTTLLAVAPGRPVRPRFGPASAAAHRATGAVELTGDWPSLRHDVDTPADLLAAAELGLGPATSAWTARHAVA